MISIRNRFYYKCDSLFDGINPQLNTTIEKNGIVQHFKKNRIVFKEGSNPDGVYFIKKGKIKIYQLNPDGKSQIVYIYTAGEFLGFRTLLSNTKNPVSAETLDETTLIFYPKQFFETLLEQSPQLTKNLLVALSYEFNVWVNLLTAFSNKAVKSRVALSLLILNEKFKKNNTDKVSWIAIGREDLANLSGTTTETCVRILTQFKDDKLISSEGRKIKIKNYPEIYIVSNVY